MPTQHFNQETARAAARDFQDACQVPCRLCDENGQSLSGSAVGWSCSACQALCRRLGKSAACEKLHLYGALQAERFGGRYIYFCPCGLTWFASPILERGHLVAALVGGPILIMDEDDFFAHGFFMQEATAPVITLSAKALLSTVPKMEPSRANSLSKLLLTSALSLSDRTAELQQRSADQDQQSQISQYIYALKQSGSWTSPTYYVEKERELTRAVSHGDQSAAASILNEILGHLMFSSGGKLSAVLPRVTELLVILSRAAINGGADAEQIFGLNFHYLNELNCQTNFECLCRWLSNILRRFTSLVFEVTDIKHRDIVYKASGYIKDHYREHITLESAAEFVGYSPSYLSRVFKADMGASFNNYLNEYRIEKSKVLLLEEGATVLSVSQDVGFDDSSYFSKVFKRVTGVPPGKFRETGGRLPRRNEGIA